MTGDDAGAGAAQPDADDVIVAQTVIYHGLHRGATTTVQVRHSRRTGRYTVWTEFPANNNSYRRVLTHATVGGALRAMGRRVVKLGTRDAVLFRPRQNVDSVSEDIASSPTPPLQEDRNA